MSTTNQKPRQITRRQFLKGSAAAAAFAGMMSVAGVSAYGDEENSVLTAAAETASPAEEQIFNSPCRSNCFQSCLLNAHVRDGKVVRMSPKAYPNNDYTGCCLKGLTIPQRTYSNNRLKYPMRRVGNRGEDQWERISWDEAIAEIAEKFSAIQEQYGNRALVVDTGSGNYGLVHGVQGLVNRLSYALGATRINVCYDQGLGYGTDRVIGGGVWLHGNETEDFMNSKVVFIWGSNPVHA